VTNSAVSRQKAPGQRLLGFSVLLVILTVLAYRPVFQAEFVNYDDQAYVTENQQVLAGLTGAGVKWAFTTSEMGSWHPLTWLAHMLDVQFFGVNSPAHHAVNLGFHVLNVLLLLVLLHRLTGDLWPSFFAAALFALHPTHVESVAWVSERKDVLSTFFGLLCLLAYARFAQGKIKNEKLKSVWYGLALLFLVLGLMSKPMLVTWPVLMLLLDIWPLRRLSLSTFDFRLSTLNRLVLEKTPFFLLVGIIAAITILTQHGNEAVVSLQELSLGDRLMNSVRSVGVYVQQFFWPQNLAPFYPMQLPVSLGRLVITAVGLLMLTGAAWGTIRKWPWLGVGWFWFLIALLPVSGLVQAGLQAHADRYLYVPSIGLGVALVWGIHAAIRQYPVGRDWGIGLACAGLGLCGWLTFGQARLWQNTESLFTHALAVTQGNFIAHQALGEELLKQDRLPEARTHFESALSFYSRLPMVRNNLAVMLLMEEKYAEAAAEFESVLQDRPAFQIARFNYAKALEGLTRYADASNNYRRYLKDQPQDAEARLALIRCLTQLGQKDEVIRELQAATQALPQAAQFYTALAMAELRTGNFTAAVETYDTGLKQLPDAVDLLNNLAWLLATHRQSPATAAERAVALAERARELTQGEVPFVLGTLAAAYAAAERFPEAIATAERAIELATAAGQSKVAARNEELLKLYRAGQPYRETLSEK
jgi:tetratricopeptide (TPR) repeat protein